MSAEPVLVLHEESSGPLCPPDHLRMIWRREAVNGGVIALDPREADFVVDRGWGMLDGYRCRCSYEGPREVELDGRVSVRIEVDDPEAFETRYREQFSWKEAA